MQQMINGVTSEVPPEKVAEIKELAASLPSAQPSETERIAELESKLKALEILTGEVQ